jgi:hypothetical protein
MNAMSVPDLAKRVEGPRLVEDESSVKMNENQLPEKQLMLAVLRQTRRHFWPQCAPVSWVLFVMT